MTHADETQISRNKRTIFVGTLLFPFQPVRVEITINLPKIAISSLLSSCTIIVPSHKLLYLPVRLQVWNEWKTHFHYFVMEIFWNFQTKILVKWKVSQVKHCTQGATLHVMLHAVQSCSVCQPLTPVHHHSALEMVGATIIFSDRQMVRHGIQQRMKDTLSTGSRHTPQCVPA